jgi:hypothetical protein
MVDEIWDRQYQSGRAQLHDGFGRLVEKVRCSVATTFKSVHAIQFDAPWAPRSKDVGCA